MFMRHHIHSVMSVRDAMLKIKDIVDDAEKHGEAFALTDHGSIAGWVEMYNICKKKGIKPVFGIEAYINRNRVRLFQVLEEIEKEKDPELKKKLNAERELIKAYEHIVLLAKNQVGFHNIIELANIGFIDGFYGRPMITYDELFKLKDGIIVTSACLSGTVNRYLIRGDERAAEQYLKLMKEEFGDDFYIEIQFNNIPQQVQVNKKLILFSEKLNIPMCVGSDSHYLTLDWKETHEDLLMLQNKRVRSDVGKKDIVLKYENYKGEIKTKQLRPDAEFKRGVVASSVKVGDVFGKGVQQITITSVREVDRVFLFNGDAPYMSESELRKYAQKYHEECKKHLDIIIAGNSAIYEKIDNIEFDTTIKLPIIENANQELVKIIKKELVARGWDKRKVYIERAKHELKTIKDNGFASYFLILADFIKWARNHEIPIGAGRGSGVSSLVAFLLGIHRVNPMLKKWNGMPFERFLATSRYEKKIIIYDEHNNKKEFTSSDIVEIDRNKQIIQCNASELKEGDIFIRVIKRNIT